jgi:hypothetical protein
VTSARRLIPGGFSFQRSVVVADHDEQSMGAFGSGRMAHDSAAGGASSQDEESLSKIGRLARYR